MTKKYKLNVWLSFDENGGEYNGTLEIKCDTFYGKVGERKIIVNGAEVEIDEKINDIEVLHNSYNASQNQKNEDSFEQEIKKQAKVLEDTYDKITSYTNKEEEE